eukprot:tig00020554_g10801.t1
MDKLKAEIERKRKLVESAAAASGNAGKKWVKRADLEAEKLKQLEAERPRSSPSPPPKPSDADARASPPPEASGQSKNDAADGEEQKAKLPKPDVIRRLRARGQPITLFGETDIQREERLKLVEATIPELMEGQKNDMQRLLEEQEQGERSGKEKSGSDSDSDDDARKRGKRVGGKASDSESGAGGPSGVEKELKDEEYIVQYLKRMLREWEESLDSRPDAVKKTAQGKVDTATQKQCYRYLKPFFSEMRKRQSPPDIVRSVRSIITHMENREYVKAHEDYMKLAIGNAPWPMGVTMVGIHERSAREKIHSNQVAHVLNDETQRKYIQSVKRVMTFVQKKYPADPSRSVW